MGNFLFGTVRVVEATLVYLLAFAITQYFKTPIPAIGSPMYIVFVVLWPIVIRPILGPGLRSIPIIGDILDLLDLIARSGIKKQQALKECVSDEELEKRLNAPEAVTRRDAISAIAKRGNQRWIGNLLSMLDDEDEFVRVYAANALGAIGDETVVSKLKEKRASVSADVQFHFDEAVAQIRNRCQTEMAEQKHPGDA